MYQLLKDLCNLQATSGNESAMSDFLLNYIKEHQSTWKVRPEIFYGTEFQHCIILSFGQPRTAVFAHMDNIGFTVRYGKQLVKIGGPQTKSGYSLVGADSKGVIECKLNVDEEEQLQYEYHREIDRGTMLSFKPDFRESNEAIQCCYMDDRLGILTALKLCETIKDGLIIFSCWEEHHGGSVPYLAKFIYEQYKIHQALICDITWITDGISHGKGVVISMRDSGIPRKIYVEKIIAILQEADIPYQLEVEKSGGSDGNELQRQPYPIDWCFVGAAEENVHTPDEYVYKADINTMIAAYRKLLEKL